MKKPLHSSVCEDHIFSKLYDTYAQPLANHLYYKYGEVLNPKDTAQEAFIKLWENCKKVALDKAKSYLYTIANNMMLNHVKHHKVVLNYRKIQPKDYTNESPEFLLQKDEFLKNYQEVLGRLSEEQRVAFLLNKAEGKKHQEIADELGITKKVVEYRIYSAFKKIKEELEGFNIK
ncbi:DNA-directed RNA polymerase sigma-70 factor [Dokdonia pacifica]|uniref:RNA polymerase sigma-70 factor, ECF subfamily n=1 Tax=Dokdonia pacifica TaxID=1627892 RepID=A0A238ZIR6_9FLAO|nr:sigma-70 family RNA polymerase sigma factor [Dokdonia pacifica]GGG06614.1 DNA-directed RNA polymerase sigma-70 factor [Dokdonia pacifica]SNR82888.1 RNA polymerase sigma-70 factor, ECF subfamily [Dokdonia pacifica]